MVASEELFFSLLNHEIMCNLLEGHTDQLVFRHDLVALQVCAYPCVCLVNPYICAVKVIVFWPFVGVLCTLWVCVCAGKQP